MKGPVLHVIHALVALTVAALTGELRGQLTPERTYYGVDRPVPMRVEAPEGASVEIVVLEPQAFQETNRITDLDTGEIDLGPAIWKDKSHDVRYVQLEIDGRATGPAVVLVPMVSPNYAHLVNTLSNGLDPTFDVNRGAPMFESQRLAELARKQGLTPEEVPQRPVTYSGVRAFVDRNVIVETTLGQIEFRLRPDEAPNTVRSFLDLVEGGFYTDVIIHRIFGARDGNPPFVIQFGDPTASGTGGPGFYVDLELSRLPHDFGVLSMARSTDPNSNGSQVFICLSRRTTAVLDRDYTAFAEAVSGAEVIQAIGALPVDQRDYPIAPEPRVVRAWIVDAPPAGTGPPTVKPPEAVPAER